MSQLNFNVGGDPGDDKPYLIVDGPPPVRAEGRFTPGRFILDFPPMGITGAGWFYYQNGTKKFRIIVPPPDPSAPAGSPDNRQFEAGLPPCIPPEYHGDVEKVALHYTPVVQKRTGIVRLDGHAWLDDTGYFHPLGASFLCALSLWRKDQVRFRRWATFFAKHQVDYARMFGQTTWAGDDVIDPAWPDYPAIIRAVIDCLYDEFGIRSQITCLTEGSKDPIGVTRKIVDAVLGGRRHKVLLLEGVNEGKDDEMVARAAEIGRELAQAGVPFAVGLGNQGREVIESASVQCGANVACYHPERVPNDPARDVRACWNFPDFHDAPVDNEPPGHASSVSQQDDPDVLAAMRFGAIVCGAGPFTQHHGDLVYGKDMQGSYGHRYANPDEPPIVDLMDRMFTAVRNADMHIPAGIQNWATFNERQPVEISAGADRVNKVYGARADSRLVEIVIGVGGPIACTLRARENVAIKVINISTGAVIIERDLNIGQEQPISGLKNYGLIGHMR